MIVLRNRVVVAVVGLLVGILLALSGVAAAQSVQVKHFACYGPGPQSLRNFYYLANGADPCPTGWTKIDWLDD